MKSKLFALTVGFAIVAAPALALADGATDGAGGAITTAGSTISAAVTNNIGIAIPISVLLLVAVVGWKTFKRLTAK